ncbi:hypothetical protein LSUE1_G004190 [Lachnellula suecica]|uniref:BTB domain-containing protein n=1 Tax=Lachnellula suecica TaxID=602035 RepID=A0A8T9CA51_9HELO|nr:hypothetical protein LSUE1_G004190 [Lachnellula suecica]
MEARTQPHLRSPILFAAPVFDDLEFHVHSVVLKLHSAFFRNFLDSPDKEKGGAPLLRKFKYEWVTMLDEDCKDWHIVAASASPLKALDLAVFNEEGASYPFFSKQQREQEGFEKLLCAIYNRPYKIDFYSLIVLTRQADYYCALPAVSNSLGNAILNSKGFQGHTLWNHCPELLPIAIKLRHGLLFKDCITLCLGPWNEPFRHKFDDLKLRKLAQNLHNQIAAKIGDFHQDILKSSSQPKLDEPPSERLHTLMHELNANGI